MTSIDFASNRHSLIGSFKVVAFRVLATSAYRSARENHADFELASWLVVVHASSSPVGNFVRTP